MNNAASTVWGFVVLALIAIAVILGLMFGLPMYNVWQQEMSGRAELAKAEQNRQIKCNDKCHFLRSHT